MCLKIRWDAWKFFRWGEHPVQQQAQRAFHGDDKPGPGPRRCTLACSSPRPAVSRRRQELSGGRPPCSAYRACGLAALLPWSLPYVVIYIYIYIYIHGISILHPRCRILFYTVSQNWAEKNTEQYWRTFSIIQSNTQDREILNNTETRVLNDTEFCSV